ncbi:MAG: DUF4962 domain-containing protein [Candidatus Cyclobacteriaceae bacterium M3_2C_046]
MMLIGNTHDPPASHNKKEKHLPDEIHPRIRQWNSPSGGIEAKTNPPSFLWPIAEEGNYTIRISRDSLFAKEEVRQSDLSWAIYNPHQKLGEGTWYWQVKSSDGAWQPRSRFKISGTTPTYVTPAFSQLLQGIPQSHPRLLIFARELNSLRKRAGGYEDNKIILQKADEAINKELPAEEEAEPAFQGKTEYQTKKIAKDFSKKVGREVLKMVEPVCQAFILTGNEKYLLPVLQWSRQLSSWDPEGPTRVNDFADSQIMYSMALIYDTFYDKLAKTDKKQLLEAIAARGSHFYDHWINNLEARLVSNHVWQFNLYRLFMTSLAVMGDLPEAKNWMHYIYDIWLARAPILGGADGGWVHGVSYFHINTVTLLDLPAKLEKITGFNYIQDDFYANNMTWLNYAYPPFSTSDGFADGSEAKYAPDLQILGYVDALARINQDQLASWYLSRVLAEKTDHIFQNDDFRWYRISRGYLTSVPEPSDDNALPLASLFPEVGMVYMHSNLNDHHDNMMIAMRSSPYGAYSHMHADQNTFNIAYGGKRLFFNSGYKVSMADKHSVDWYKATQGHNGILINGKGQKQTTAGWGYISGFIHGNKISYAAGDAAAAYNFGVNEDLVQTFRRHVLMLRPQPVIIIYDELEVTRESTFSWLIHSYHEIIKETESWFFTENEGAKGWVYLTGSQQLDFEVTDQFGVEPENFRRKEGGKNLYPDQWHFKANNSAKSKKMRFLAIIQIAVDSKKPEVVKKAEGAFLVDGWQITAQLDVDQQASIMVCDTSQSVTFTSSGHLKQEHARLTGEQKPTLIEFVEGKEVVKTSDIHLPRSFDEAYANLK